MYTNLAFISLFGRFQYIWEDQQVVFVIVINAGINLSTSACDYRFQAADECLDFGI